VSDTRREIFSDEAFDLAMREVFGGAREKWNMRWERKLAASRAELQAKESFISIQEASILASEALGKVDADAQDIAEIIRAMRAVYRAERRS
jgi:hypothetical protein